MVYSCTILQASLQYKVAQNLQQYIVHHNNYSVCMRYGRTAQIMHPSKAAVNIKTKIW